MPREHNPAIIPHLLGVPLKAFKNDEGWSYDYLFLPFAYVPEDRDHPFIRLNVRWQHWGERHRQEWNSSLVRLNNYDFEVLNADYERTGVFHRRA